MNIASVVPRPGMKPNCISSMDTLSLVIFSLNSFHNIIKEFKTSVVTSYQRITFRFVEVDDKTIFSVRLDGTIPYHVICKLSDQP